MATSSSQIAQLHQRAHQVHASLIQTRSELDNEQPETVRVKGGELLKLSFDEETRQTAHRAIDGFGTGSRRDGGEDFWYRNVGIIKFGFLHDLAAGWQVTRDEEYAAAARDYFEDFFDYFDGPPWDGSGVRITVRTTRWVRFLPYFLDSDIFGADLVRRVVDGARSQINHQFDNIVEMGNVRLFQANLFVWARLMLPWFAESADWIRAARDIYTDTAYRDLEPDGSHSEHEPNYHGLYQGTFEKLQFWSRAFPEENLPCFPEKTARIFDYAVASHRPNGQVCGLQDGAAAWLANGSMEPILQRRRRARRLAGLEDEPPPLARSFPDAGQVYMRDGWGPDASYVTFDATRWGGAHSHLARNGIQLHANGRTLVADPGFFTYAMQHAAHRGDDLTNRIGPYAKSTPAHNTVNLNGWNQAPTNPDELKCHLSETCHVVYSRYSGGYWPGWYGWWFGEGYGAGVHADHDRILFWLPGRVAVVVDTMVRGDETKFGEEEHRHPTLEMNWQLTPGPAELDLDKQKLVARYDQSNLLMTFAELPENMDMEIKEGQTAPFRGWIGTGRGVRDTVERAGGLDNLDSEEWADLSYMPAPQLCCVADPMEEYGETFVTVLVPFQTDETPEVSATASGDIFTSPTLGKGGGCLSLEWGDGACDRFLWAPRLRSPIGDYADGRTDACALHLHLDASGKLQDGTAVEATYCEPWAPERRDEPASIELGLGVD